MKEDCFKLKKARSRQYPAETITDADYADDLSLLVNTLTQSESLLPRLEQAAGGIGFHVNAEITEYIYFNQKGNISSVNGGFQKPWTSYPTTETSLFDERSHELQLIGYRSYEC